MQGINGVGKKGGILCGRVEVPAERRERRQSEKSLAADLTGVAAAASFPSVWFQILQS